VDYGYTKLDKICTKNKKVDCHLVDTRPVNPSKPADGDHIHPDGEGYKALAGKSSRPRVSMHVILSNLPHAPTDRASLTQPARHMYHHADAIWDVIVENKIPLA